MDTLKSLRTLTLEGSLIFGGMSLQNMEKADVKDTKIWRVGRLLLCGDRESVFVALIL